jgi:hypothetical protein
MNGAAPVNDFLSAAVQIWLENINRAYSDCTMKTRENFKWQPESNRPGTGFALVIICLITLAWVLFSATHRLNPHVATLSATFINGHQISN